MDTSSPNEFVLVPVPKDRVLDVMAFLTSNSDNSTRVANPDPAASQPLDSEPDPDPDAGWDPESLGAFVRDTNTPEKQVLVLEHLAKRAGQWVTGGELQAVLADSLSPDYPGRALGAVMRALGLRSQYWDGREKPFNAEWRDGVNRYRMREDYARPILEAVAERRIAT